MGKRLAELKKDWLRDPDFRSEYEAQDSEFAVARALVRARVRANLTQAQLAARMGTTQSAVARMESGRHMPSMKTIRRYAEATGCRVRLDLVPA
jgi:DNA-binding XRE family transcriptional regulator